MQNAMFDARTMKVADNNDTSHARAVYCQRSGNLETAAIGQRVPAYATHFDSSVDAEKWSTANGFRFYVYA